MLPEMSFHHGFITDVVHVQDAIVLAIEGAVRIADDGRWTPEDGALRLGGVTSLTMQGRAVRRMTLAGEEGLIRRVWERGCEGMEFLVAWRAYRPRREMVRRHRIACAHAAWTPTSSCAPAVPPDDARERLRRERTDLAAWAAAAPTCGDLTDYPGWPWLIRAVSQHLQAIAPDAWRDEDVALLLAALAGHEQFEGIKRMLGARPAHLVALAAHGIATAEAAARWQLADALGEILPGNADVDALATAYAMDSDDYVSRRALIALGRRRAPRAEEFAMRAWASGDTYRRMAALDVLAAIGSGRLDACLAAAESDGQPDLMAFAARLRGSR
jgi:hypothetical protein